LPKHHVNCACRVGPATAQARAVATVSSGGSVVVVVDGRVEVVVDARVVVEVMVVVVRVVVEVVEHPGTTEWVQAPVAGTQASVVQVSPSSHDFGVMEQPPLANRGGGSPARSCSGAPSAP
jgi:hypothetical protein